MNKDEFLTKFRRACRHFPFTVVRGERGYTLFSNLSGVQLCPITAVAAMERQLSWQLCPEMFESDNYVLRAQDLGISGDLMMQITEASDGITPKEAPLPQALACIIHEVPFPKESLMTIDEFYQLLGQEISHYNFKLDISFSECAPGHHPLLRAETYIDEKGEHHAFEDDFCPLSAVVRRHLPRLKEESLIDHSLQEWGEELGLSKEDTTDLIHAQDGVLNTPRRQEIRHRLDKIAGVNVLA